MINMTTNMMTKTIAAGSIALMLAGLAGAAAARRKKSK